MIVQVGLEPPLNVAESARAPAPTASLEAAAVVVTVGVGRQPLGRVSRLGIPLVGGIAVVVARAGVSAETVALPVGRPLQRDGWAALGSVENGLASCAEVNVSVTVVLAFGATVKLDAPP